MLVTATWWPFSFIVRPHGSNQDKDKDKVGFNYHSRIPNRMGRGKLSDVEVPSTEKSNHFSALNVLQENHMDL